jgi:2-polyprenyl-3-methyl-5-hydroxy-6-metoxy-1,4-benzoquinol methylase
MKLSIAQSTELWRLLADPSRLRLLLLLEAQPLSVAELTEITGLAQSRVSTHLARLTRASLVRAQRTGGAAQYSLSAERGRAAELWAVMRERLEDPLSQIDRERAEQVVRARSHGQTWAESVAGRMELHYSPGRTWEATARALIGLLNLGDVLDVASGDGVLAELIAERARTVTCADISAKVLAAARKRLVGIGNVDYFQADMRALPFAARSFDHVFLMHALQYAKKPDIVISEAARTLRPGGRLIVATLNAHSHEAAMQAYDHVNLGVMPEVLEKWLAATGLTVESCRITSRDPRPPYFEVVTALARAGSA